MDAIVEILAAFAGSFGFGITFNLHGKNLLLASVGGLLDWTVYIFAGFIFPYPPFQYFCGALFLGLYSEAIARLRKTPTTVYLVVGFIPLIPGSALFHMGNQLFLGSWSQFSHYGIISLYTAASIAGGIITSIFITQIYIGIKNRYLLKNKNYRRDKLRKTKHKNIQGGP